MLKKGGKLRIQTISGQAEDFANVIRKDPNLGLVNMRPENGPVEAEKGAEDVFDWL